MYKIKDSVDLKELEKFGFKKNREFYIHEINEENSYYKNNYIRIRNLKDYTYYKEIWYCGKDALGIVHSSCDNLENYIQDLIKADLVEEVSNE